MSVIVSAPQSLFETTFYPGYIVTAVINAPREGLLIRLEPLGPAYGLKKIAVLARTLDKRCDGLIYACVHRISTSPLEGVNCRAKLLKRIAYGYRDIRFFMLKLKAAFPGMRHQSMAYALGVELLLRRQENRSRSSSDPMTGCFPLRDAAKPPPKVGATPKTSAAARCALQEVPGSISTLIRTNNRTRVADSQSVFTKWGNTSRFSPTLAKNQKNGQAAQVCARLSMW